MYDFIASLFTFHIHAIGFAGQMKSLNALNSSDNNQNIASNKRAYSLITETFSYAILSNDTK